MPTDSGRRAARNRVHAAMAGETISSLASRANVDPQTLGDFLAGRRWPIGRTLNKIEDALSLDRGTLAALGEELTPGIPVGAGEDSSGRDPKELDDFNDVELVETLTYRLGRLRRERNEALAELERLRRMQGERSDAGQAEAQKTGGAARPAPPRDAFELAADEQSGPLDYDRHVIGDDPA